MTEHHWTSPNNVDHLIINGHCMTCGKPHADEEAS